MIQVTLCYFKVILMLSLIGSKVTSLTLMLNNVPGKQMVITRKKHPSSPVNLILDGKALEMVNAYRYLGVWITNELSWTKQKEENCKKGILYRNSTNTIPLVCSNVYTLLLSVLT